MYLRLWGLDKKEINGAVRISFDRLTEEADVIKAAEIIAKEVATIKEIYVNERDYSCKIRRNYIKGR